MKKIFIIGAMVLTCGLSKAQEVRMVSGPSSKPKSPEIMYADNSFGSNANLISIEVIHNLDPNTFKASSQYINLHISRRDLDGTYKLVVLRIGLPGQKISDGERYGLQIQNTDGTKHSINFIEGAFKDNLYKTINKIVTIEKRVDEEGGMGEKNGHSLVKGFGFPEPFFI